MLGAQKDMNWEDRPLKTIKDNYFLKIIYLSTLSFNNFMDLLTKIYFYILKKLIFLIKKRKIYMLLQHNIIRCVFNYISLIK